MTTQREGMRKLRAVSDASVLIHLSAIGRFHLLMDLFQGIVIPKGVYEEVRNISYEYGISISNAEVIQLAKEMNAEVVLADEEEVREGAEEGGFDVRGCLGILLESVKRGILTPQKAMQDVDGLVESGYRVSEEVVNKVKEILRRWES